MREETKIMYGTYATQVTVSLPDGESCQHWFCKKCRRIRGTNDEHMASRCCCTHLTCKCGNIHSKSWTMCDTCRDKIAYDKWQAKPEVIWDGEWPIALHDSDRYFFSADDLLDYIDEVNEDGYFSESLRLTSCRANTPRTFEVNEWVGDDLYEDGEILDADSIDDRINAILGEIGIMSFSSNSDRLNVRDVLRRIGFEKEENIDSMDTKGREDADE